MIRHHAYTLAAVAATTAALAAPASADAASCFKELPGPNGTTWRIDTDGSQESATYLEGGSNFDEGHGRLTVNGSTYPKIALNQSICTTTATSIQYPHHNLGDGLSVRRNVASVGGGRIRRLDTIVNNTDLPKLVDVEYAFRVLGSQVSVDSESGSGFEVTSDDHWSVHENSGGSNPFLQWGEDSDSHDPDVVSEGDTPAIWQHQTGTMPDAHLEYESISVPANGQVRLLHMSGTTASEDASRAAATDGATPFAGMTRAQALEVVNWGKDPDKDGVLDHEDECPGTKGNQADGCLLFIVVPDDNDNGGDDGGDGQNPPPPGDGGDGNGNGGETQPSGDGQHRGSGNLADTTAPKIALSKLGRKARRGKLGRKGLKPRIACDEACTLSVVVRRGRNRTLVTRVAGLSNSARSLKLKLRKKQLRRAKRLTLVIAATDAAGNRSTLTRVVRIGR